MTEETVTIQVSERLVGLAGEAAAKLGQYEDTTDFIEKAIEYFLEAAKALENDQVAFIVKMPEKLWHALTWYAKHTRHWVSNDYEDKTYNALIVEFITDCMEAEAETPRLGISWLKQVLGDEYELNPSIPMN